ncbi:hypothetical protein Tco_0086307 [Tanacetum coccineum]
MESSNSNERELQLTQRLAKQRHSNCMWFEQLETHLRDLYLNSSPHAVDAFKPAFHSFFGEEHQTFRLKMFRNLDHYKSQDVQINPVQAVDDSLIVSKSSWIESENNNALSTSVNETQLQQLRVQHWRSLPLCMRNQTLLDLVLGGNRRVFFKIAGLRWIPTRKMFTDNTTKVDREPLNGSNDDITNPYECDQTLNVSAGTLNLSAVDEGEPTGSTALEATIATGSGETESSKKAQGGDIGLGDERSMTEVSVKEQMKKLVG